MKKYIFKRILFLLIALFLISIFIFILFQLQPGNPYYNAIKPGMSQDMIEKVLTDKGYYDPIHIKYLKWLVDLFHLDFGYSIQFKMPVLQLLVERLPKTLLLTVPTLIISFIFSLVVSFINVVYRPKWLKPIVDILVSIGVSMPTFLLGIFAIRVFSMDLKILPISGLGSGELSDIVWHLILPVFVLVFINSSAYIQLFSSLLTGELRKEYLILAEAKGLTYHQAMLKHGLVNILPSLLTIFFMGLPGVFSGAVITESLFLLGGIGQLNNSAVMQQDYPVVMAVLIITVFLTLFSNFLADILNFFIDKRQSL